MLVHLLYTHISFETLKRESTTKWFNTKAVYDNISFKYLLVINLHYKIHSMKV